MTLCVLCLVSVFKVCVQSHVAVMCYVVLRSPS
jgi:hypothetical protein